MDGRVTPRFGTGGAPRSARGIAPRGAHGSAVQAADGRCAARRLCAPAPKGWALRVVPEGSKRGRSILRSGTAPGAAVIAQPNGKPCWPQTPLYFSIPICWRANFYTPSQPRCGSLRLSHWNRRPRYRTKAPCDLRNGRIAPPGADSRLRQRSHGRLTALCAASARQSDCAARITGTARRALGSLSPFAHHATEGGAAEGLGARFPQRPKVWSAESHALRSEPTPGGRFPRWIYRDATK